MMPLYVDEGMGKNARSEDNPKELQATPPAVLEPALCEGKWRGGVRGLQRGPKLKKMAPEVLQSQL